MQAGEGHAEKKNLFQNPLIFKCFGFKIILMPQQHILDPFYSPKLYRINEKERKRERGGEEKGRKEEENLKERWKKGKDCL